MKKLLMCSAACVLGLAVAGPAKADGIKLDLAGHFKGYVTWLNQDTTAGTDERHFSILRETEIHFTGETTLDNGLTVGVHHEADIDSEYGNNDLFKSEESYAYFSGAWGRVNFGKEDGANYLLQVATPSADENYDGLRQFINPENIFLTAISNLADGSGGFPATGQVGGLGSRGFMHTGKLDYANDATGYSNKITYLTPVWSGFQAGGSYTPATDVEIGGSGDDGSRAFGVHQKGANNANVYGDAWEGAARYEGKWQDVGVTLGGGYTHVALATSHAAPLFGAGSPHTNVDDFNQWNLGAAVTWQQLGLGVAYTKDNGGLSNDGDNRTWVVGVDWTTGPFKLGASYTNNHEELGDSATGVGAAVVSNGTLDTTRWAGGVVYTYGPGMTFRGSVGFVRSDIPDEQAVAVGTDSVKATDVLLGTQINF
jgi:outer membrane protein OmpU